jgi:tRNA G18 (ribose-2'-O)-methylase SpoU
VELPLHNPFWSKIWQIETVKTLLPTTRGYFGIGVERISKAVNLGNLLRSAHAFGASFAFTVGASGPSRCVLTRPTQRVTCRSITGQALPQCGCRRGAALWASRFSTRRAIAQFSASLRAAYILGPERGRLLVALCQHLVRIPTAFSLNVGTAGAIVMYDRLRCLGRFAPRPVGQSEPRKAHIQGAPRKRRRQG